MGHLQLFAKGLNGCANSTYTGKPAIQPRMGVQVSVTASADVI
jgi:hypothetical protein